MSRNKEADSVNKRGRPRKFGAMQDGITATATHVGTQRGKADLCYRAWATAILSEDSAFEWLFEGRGRASLLTELGRLHAPEIIRRVATSVCQAKPTTKDAVARIRAIRLGQKASAWALYDTLSRAVDRALNRYRAAHPDITLEQERAAFIEMVKDLRQRE